MVRPALARYGVAPQADTSVIAEREDITAGANCNLEPVAAPAKRSGMASHDTPPDCRAAQVTDQVDLGLEHDAHEARMPRLRIEPRPRPARRRIEIGRDSVGIPCRYDTVLDHDREQAAADETAFAAYVGQVAAAVRDAPLPVASGSPDAGPDAAIRAGFARQVKPVAARGWRPFHDARVAARKQVDTPEETRRLSHVRGRDA
jgi:hypothetical protein